MALFAAVLAGQSFDVASIRPSASPGMRFDRTPANGFRATGVTLKYLVQMAYDVEDFQVFGGPGWIRADRFDISANATDPVADSPESFRMRLRALLASRFRLGVREEAKDGPVYFLEQAKGGSKLIPSESGSARFGRNRGLLTTDCASPAMLARTLSAILLRPVRDHTGLNGSFAFKLQWAEGGLRASRKIRECRSSPPFRSNWDYGFSRAGTLFRRS